MSEQITQNAPPVKVLLLGLDMGQFDAERSMDELAALCEANNMEAVASLLQKKDAPEAGTVLGEGKLAEARLTCENLGAEAAVFDGELSGSQLRNISTRWAWRSSTAPCSFWKFSAAGRSPARARCRRSWPFCATACRALRGWARP